MKNRGNDTFYAAVFSLATGVQAPQFYFKSLLPTDWWLSLCVWLWCSGQVESGFLTGDKWPWLHFLASGQSVGSQGEHLGASCPRLGRDERGTFQNMFLCSLMQLQAPTSLAIEETLDRNSGLSYHLVSCLYLSGFGASRGRWGVKKLCPLPSLKSCISWILHKQEGKAPDEL